MRSSFLHLVAVLLPAGLGAVVTLGACTTSSDATLFSDGSRSDAPGGGFASDSEAAGDRDAVATTPPAADAAAAAPLGSPLCGLTAQSACSPDDDGASSLAYGAPPCASTPDGKEDDDAPVAACRLAHAGGTTTPACVPASATPDGVDGVACTGTADCAPGFDCVTGPQGSVCRHYCCAGTCESQRAMNGGSAFCDVQKLADGARDVPVCMPLKKCTLLVPGGCASGETCAVVDEKGESGCVPVGGATAGAGCDVDHCAKGLTCLGTPGDRRCYTLCKTNGADGACLPGQSCTTGAIFQDSAVGVCQSTNR